MWRLLLDLVNIIPTSSLIFVLVERSKPDIFLIVEPLFTSQTGYCPFKPRMSPKLQHRAKYGISLDKIQQTIGKHAFEDFVKRFLGQTKVLVSLWVKITRQKVTCWSTSVAKPIIGIPNWKGTVTWKILEIWLEFCESPTSQNSTSPGISFQGSDALTSPRQV